MFSDFKFSIDRGGTFTDIYCEYQSNSTTHSLVYKLLSNDPANYQDAPTEGIRRILSQVTSTAYAYPVDTSKITSIRMGTTVATNALLERKGQKFALITTKGFKDLLLINNQSRPDIFALHIQRCQKLFAKVLEVDERVKILKSAQPGAVKGTTGEYFEVLKSPDESLIRSELMSLKAEGFDTVSICLVHSYSFRLHEVIIYKIAKELGFKHVSMSCEVMPMFKYLPRMSTAALDAYLTPILQDYIQSFVSGFDEGVAGVEILFMQSDGGLCEMKNFIGSKAILSGPAGGVVGYSSTGEENIIGFDMGGTSTDVSRFDKEFSHVFEAEISGVSIQGSHLDIQTVAAGGGSRLFYRSGLYTVGPESSGAWPGPVCYRNGGYLSITDANLVLGRIEPDFFPSIFGPNKDMPLDKQSAIESFQKITEEIYKEQGETKSIFEVALGFVKVANETMCRPIRNITSAKGFDPGNHILSCFGGAGGQHACSIARSLGIKRIVVHRYSGILSAYGLGLAKIRHEQVEPTKIYLLRIENDEEIQKVYNQLVAKISTEFQPKGVSKTEFRCYLHVRFEGSDTVLPVYYKNDLLKATEKFKKQYFREFGFLLSNRELICDSIRVTAIAEPSTLKASPVFPTSPPVPLKETLTYFDHSAPLPTQVFHLNTLPVNFPVQGPALILNEISCILIEPFTSAQINLSGNLEISIFDCSSTVQSFQKDSVLLSLFAHRFMGIAEQMGRTLQRTSISTNIKERLDYSCAIFSSDGSLVANAPHLPVHLGSMQEAVKKQIEFNENWEEGEVVFSNHPQAGGSHLPDITVVTPVFDKGHIVFFVASRGHHADIGGVTPGSMPPFSKCLDEEGVAVMTCKMVKNGIFQEEEIRNIFKKSRCLEDNISDLKAQSSANNKGIELIKGLIKEYSLEVVLSYMKFIQEAARQSVEDLLISTFNTQKTLKASDYLDDGTKIKLRVEINQNKACFDFTGTGSQVLNNLNSPPAVVKSAILYCLRCLVKTEIPLNQGCMDPISLIIPSPSILSPTPDAAVVGGNVLTSQRITDVIFKAFSACAASQGCMNNLTFGNQNFGFYETIAGGSGAGNGWHGESGVHTHMTNTRITDIEIMERRYPVLVKRFCLRPQSGGKGKFRGGDGVIREIEFLDDMVVSVLSERRSFRPYGLMGGGCGKPGVNFLVKDGVEVNIGGKAMCEVRNGDRVIIMTPGGGGYGME